MTPYTTQVLHDLSRSLPQNGRQGSNYQHALLGEIRFNLITYFEGMSRRSAVDYAEMHLVGRKPKLQHTGQKLDDLTWEISLDHQYCDPELEVSKINRAMQSKAAQQLVFANGLYEGWYVITDFDKRAVKTAKDGTTLKLTGTLSLKEYVVDKPTADSKANKPPVAVKRSGGSVSKPAETVRRTPVPRPATAPMTRSGR